MNWTEALGAAASAASLVKVGSQALGASRAERQAKLNMVLRHVDDAIAVVNTAVVQLQSGAAVDYQSLAERIRLAVDAARSQARRLDLGRVVEILDVAEVSIDHVRAAAFAPPDMAILGLGTLSSEGVHRLHETLYDYARRLRGVVVAMRRGGGLYRLPRTRRAYVLARYRTRLGDLLQRTPALGPRGTGVTQALRVLARGLAAGRHAVEQGRPPTGYAALDATSRDLVRRLEQLLEATSGLGFAPMGPAFGPGGGGGFPAFGFGPFGPMTATSPQAVTTTGTMVQRMTGANLQRILPLLRNARLLIARELRSQEGGAAGLGATGLFGGGDGSSVLGQAFRVGAAAALAYHAWKRHGGEVEPVILWAGGALVGGPAVSTVMLGAAFAQGYGRPKVVRS